MEAIFDTFGIDLRLLLVQVVNFGLLLLALWYVLYRPVMRMLDERQQTIARGVRDAEQAAVDREEAVRSREATLSEARGRAEELLKEARVRAIEREQEMFQETQEKSERTLQETRERAAQERERIIAESRKEIARLSVLGAEKVIREKAG